MTAPIPPTPPTSEGNQCCVCGQYFRVVVEISGKYYCYTHKPTYGDQQMTIEALRAQLEQAQRERDAAAKANSDEREAWSHVYAILTGTEYGEGWTLKDLKQSAQTIVKERDQARDERDDVALARDQLSDALHVVTLQNDALRAQLRDAKE